jgi:hypothetical protein
MLAIRKHPVNSKTQIFLAIKKKPAIGRVAKVSAVDKDLHIASMKRLLLLIGNCYEP